MKKIFYIIFGVILSITNVFAVENITGISNEKLREGDVKLDDIPNVLSSFITIGIYIAGSVAMIGIIVGAYKILFGSIQNKNEGKDAIIAAIFGLIIAILSWSIIKFIFDNLG